MRSSMYSIHCYPSEQEFEASKWLKLILTRIGKWHRDYCVEIPVVIDIILSTTCNCVKTSKGDGFHSKVYEDLFTRMLYRKDVI